MAKMTTTDTEAHEDIALRLLCGDESVIEDILRRPGYAPAVQGALCKKYEGYLNEQDIEDIVAVAIRKLWDYRESYDESKGSVRSLLYRIADNYAKDVQKQGWYKARQKEIVIEPNEDGDDPLEQLAQYDRYLGQRSYDDADLDDGSCKLESAIHKVLNTLRPEFKYILEADAYAGDDGISQAELAKRLNVPVGTAKVWRSRARDEFRKGMKTLGYDL